MYVDTCLVAKLYFPEPESDDVQRIVQGEAELACSELVVTEFASVASRKRHEGSVTSRQQDRVLRTFAGHVKDARWSLVPVTPTEIEQAAVLIRKCQNRVRLRTLDAIHLATCLGYQLFPLFTTDRVMLAAAAFLDIPTRTPSNRDD